ncbi:4496_t:CDS:2, partial [Gigaspora margarita]
DKNDEFKDSEDDELENAKSEDNTLALHLEDITHCIIHMEDGMKRNL